MEDITTELYTGRSVLTTAKSEFKFTAYCSSIITNATHFSKKVKHSRKKKFLLNNFFFYEGKT